MDLEPLAPPDLAPEYGQAPELALFGQPNPSDVRAVKDRLQTYVEDFDQAIRTSRAIPSNVAAAYVSWRSRWATFYTATDNVFTAPSSMSRAKTFEADVAAWHKRLSDYVELSMPAPSPSGGAGTGSGGSIFNWNPADTASNAAGSLLDTIKVVAVVGGVAFLAIVGFTAYNASHVTRGAVEGVTRRALNPRRRRRR